MDTASLYKNLNEGILEERFRAFQNNLDKNLGIIHECGGLKNVIPAFTDKHIIIAGSGPSLENELDVLKKYQFRDNIIIIAADMALLPLTKNGIAPHFVISCEATPVDYFSNIETGKMHLLAFSCMSNTNLRKWTGRVSFYNWMIHNDMYNSLWEKAGNDLGFVATGSIVTTQAVSIAAGCTVSSIMLIGNDLGFSAEYYTRGTINYIRNLHNVHRLKPLETHDFYSTIRARNYRINRGDKYYFTNNQFLAAKYWLEDLFKKTRLPVYDSGEPGCSPEVVKKTSLKKYLENTGRKRSRRRK
ncbi:MAG: DUF115 domain-containing protein [Spirochaetes bacterium]|nr:DUF115 domain-containing protein [Spirochaetota bacterium]